MFSSLRLYAVSDKNIALAIVVLVLSVTPIWSDLLVSGFTAGLAVLLVDHLPEVV